MRWGRSIRSGEVRHGSSMRLQGRSSGSGRFNLPALLNPKTPVACAPPAMRYRDDTDDVSLEAKDQSVRKSLELDSAVNPIKPFAERRQFNKYGRNALDFSSKVPSQPALSHLIVFDCFDEILCSTAKKLNLHCLRRERMLSNSSSAGIDSMSPASKAALRRWTSSSQERSASGSTDPSSSSSSARNSRSCSGRVKLRISFDV